MLLPDARMQIRFVFRSFDHSESLKRRQFFERLGNVALTAIANDFPGVS